MGGQRAKASEEAPSGFRRLRAILGFTLFPKGVCIMWYIPGPQSRRDLLGLKHLSCTYMNWLSVQGFRLPGVGLNPEP